MKGIEISADRLVPTGVQERLMALADAGDVQEWGIGDIASDFFHLFWDDIKHEFPAATKKAVFSALASFCGRKPDTVRMYCRVSEGVPKELRDEFDMLQRHHHKAILTYSKGDTEEHRRLCLWWLSKADEYGGRIGPVHALEQALRENADPNPDPDWMTRWRRVMAQLDKLSADEEAPQSLRDSVNAAILTLQDPHIPPEALEGNEDSSPIHGPGLEAPIRIAVDELNGDAPPPTIVPVIVEGVEIFAPGPAVAHIEEVEHPDEW